MERRLSTDWLSIQLSENFILGEFVVSKKFPALALNIIPNEVQANSLFLLCALALQPIRNEYGVVKIESGLRDIALNNALDGTEDSQHLFGEAADIIVPNQPMFEIYTFCMQKLKWRGECILYKKKGHVHLGLPSLWVRPDMIIIDE